MTKRWRILVSGVGSVGERHIRNLLSIEQDDIAVHRTRGLPFRTLDREFPAYNDLRKALDEWRPEVVLVTGPTAQHIEVATVAAQAGCHVFVEKPLSHTANGQEALESALTRAGRSLMIGYMLRFHPLLQQIRRWLDEGTLGKPLYWRSVWGEYLPDWHPWEDYRESYAARRDLGGGPALTLSHDLDLVLWLFGSVRQWSALAMPESPLQLDFPPGVDYLLNHESGVASSVHLDFYQRPPQRRYELVATRAKVIVDYYAGQLHLHSYPDNDAISRGLVVTDASRRVIEVPDGWDRNDMFIDELTYFFRCLEAGQTPQPGLDAGAAIAELAGYFDDGRIWNLSSRSED